MEEDVSGCWSSTNNDVVRVAAEEIMQTLHAPKRRLKATLLSQEAADWFSPDEIAASRPSAVVGICHINIRQQELGSRTEPSAFYGGSSIFIWAVHCRT